MAFKLEINPREWLTFDQQLTLLMMPTAKRKRLLWRIGAHGLIPLARKNVHGQKTPDGKPFTPRKRKSKRKMLAKLPQHLTADSSTAEKVVVRFKRGSNYNGGRSVPGIVADVHQHGATLQRTASKAREANPDVSNKPCSLNQARKLKKLGYRPRSPSQDSASGGRRKRQRAPTLKWYTENMSFRQAGLLIKKLSGHTPKQTWTIPIAARPFVGATPEQLQKIIARQLQGINYGWQVKAQDIKRR